MRQLDGTVLCPALSLISSSCPPMFFPTPLRQLIYTALTRHYLISPRSSFVRLVLTPPFLLHLLPSFSPSVIPTASFLLHLDPNTTVPQPTSSFANHSNLSSTLLYLAYLRSSRASLTSRFGSCLTTENGWSERRSRE